jgi:hypothetical protein
MMTSAERWERHADEPLAVYVAAVLPSAIAPGSGIVGRPHRSWWEKLASQSRVEISYELDYGDGEYRDRVEAAAGRLVTGTGLFDRDVVARDTLVAVGTYVPPTKTLTITDPERLDAWLRRNRIKALGELIDRMRGSMVDR